MKFEMELCKMENIDSVFVLRMKKLEGDMGKYRDICNKALPVMNL